MLEIKKLKKSFGDKIIFSDLDIEIKDGEIISILGPSGIGKTTFLRILSGLETADQGEIIIDGKSINVQEKHTIFQLGVIFQDYNLFPQYSVLGNVTLAPKVVLHQSKDEAEKKGLTILKKLGVADQKNSYPYQLSGGQKQRVAIARALAMGSNILIYDEPTSALDEESTKHVVSLIKDLKKDNVTQIIVTHDVKFAQDTSDAIFDFAVSRMKEVDK